MSVKIWVAWRVKISEFGEATDVLHREIAEKFYREYRIMLDSFWEENRNLNIEEVVRKFEKEFSSAYKKNQYNFASDFGSTYSRGFEFYLSKKFAYIIPYGGCITEIAVPNWFRDFHYQNQVNRPKRISEREYEYRRKVWDWLYATDRAYLHKVIDPHAGFYTTFLQFSLRWVEEKEKEVSCEKTDKTRDDSGVP